ncbi:hypothetical protein Pla52n_22160 [Stieleria varia]|uniref:Uncharacterized protein n=1 Tax=Stieleria varia TaxID=2528005 RepID=A0A5C6B7L3_9BACT|nr:hypothetical protein Pla52n_22160 [Stieleria varia]
MDFARNPPHLTVVVGCLKLGVDWAVKMLGLYGDWHAQLFSQYAEGVQQLRRRR